MKKTLILGALLSLTTCLPCAAKPDQDYRNRVRAELKARLSPEMWAEVKDMLVDSPGQGAEVGMPSHGGGPESVSERIKLTPREEKDLRALFQLDGNTEPAWAHKLRTRAPFQTEGTLQP